MKNLNLIILFLVLACSDKQNNIIDKQNNIINQYLHGNLYFEYYNDSIIKEAYTLNDNGEKSGKVLQFLSNGELRRIYFINNIGKFVGDESIFYFGNLSEHFFHLDENNLIFYSKFKDNKLDTYTGRPYFISVNSNIYLYDTVDFYIAAPIIPGYETHIDFGQKNVEKSKITYKNDIRQMRYKKIMNKVGKYDFCINIQIKNKYKHTVIEDYDTIQINVAPRS